MVYTDRNLAEQERAAWQAGNYELAEALAGAMQADEAETERYNLESALQGIRERITEANWRTGKKAELRELVEAIIGELAECGK